MKDLRFQSYLQEETITETRKVDSIVFLKSLFLSWMLFTGSASILKFYYKELISIPIMIMWGGTWLVWSGILLSIVRYKQPQGFKWQKRIEHFFAISLVTTIFITWNTLRAHQGTHPSFEWISLLPLFVLLYLSPFSYLFYTLLYFGFEIWRTLTVFSATDLSHELITPRVNFWNIYIPYLVIMGTIVFYKFVFSHELTQAIHRTLLLKYENRDLERKQNEFYYQAYYDFLTGLYNRAMMEKKIMNAIKIAQNQTSSISVLFIDIDNFKSINDRFGHRIGDYTLLSVATRLRETLEDAWFQNHVRENEDKGFIARLSGDEFIIVLVDSDEKRIKAICRKLVSTCSKFYKMPDVKRADTPSLSVSVGAVHMKFYGEKIYNRRQDATLIRKNLLRKSDNSMYEAKQKKNTFRFSEY